MTGMPTDPKHERNGRGFWQAVSVIFLSLATLATAGPAGYSVYKTSRDFARPFLHHEAWILPVALEAVFMVLFGWGILLSWKKVADVPARVLGSAAIAALSFAVQIDAARGSFSGTLVRVAIVASFFVASFTMKAAFMRMRGGKIRGDRLSLGEFLASPARAAGLWRWKNAWAEPSAAIARQRYMVLLYVVALAQSDPRVGRRPLRWRRKLPVTLRYQLSTGLLPDAIAAGREDWQEAADKHVASQLALLERPAQKHAPEATPAPAPGAPETAPAAAPGARPEPRSEARPEARSGAALKLPASKSRSMSPSDLAAHVSAMLDEYGTVSDAQVRRDLHVGDKKAAEALRLARKNRMSAPIGAHG